MNTYQQMQQMRHGHEAAPIAFFDRVNALAEHIPLALVQTLGRIGLASLFWKSAQTKLASWDVTLQLFENEYTLPVIPPELAANLATATEIGGAVLILTGFATRYAALALIGLVATIQLFVFPENWGEHSLWAALLVFLVARGAGPLSIDRLLKYVVSKRS